jgi:hypothetical protein
MQKQQWADEESERAGEEERDGMDEERGANLYKIKHGLNLLTS